MIFYIGGDNTYQNKLELEKITKSFESKKYQTLVQHIDEVIDFANLASKALTVGFFSSKILLIIKSMDKITAAQSEELLKLFEQNVDIVLYSNKKIDKRSKIYKHVKANGQLIESQNLTIRELPRTIRDIAKKSNLDLSAEQLVQLEKMLPNDINIINSEVSKLQALQDEGVIITSEVIESIVIKSADAKIWDLVDSLTTKNHIRSFELIDLLLKDIEYEMIIGSIVSQMRIIYLALNSSIPGSLSQYGIHPFVASKVIKYIHKYNKERILKFYQKLVDIEIAVKTGKLEKEIALDLIVIGF